MLLCRKLDAHNNEDEGYNDGKRQWRIECNHELREDEDIKMLYSTSKHGRDCEQQRNYE
ncbi:hypothetical protein KIN20_005398 [Parelaphostrongylus tenuis]|uniref:Uncharacterized protein n=1 Tax=Parelaphostrongylus tenuis TaxID=148309 RepID=A0AAD5MSP9_PARTN|nr:hypothetical protein KIN20_005398 [Parelaphostrongylus tenuis]